MITIEGMKWDNWFSYGKANFIDFTDAKVTQITGTNGSGKSFIPVILGEVLKGKNAFGKTKQQLFNRYLDKPTLFAEISIEKDGTKYIITYNRKSTLKLGLKENGVDISSHSSTETLKTINSILGFDFKLLWQLIYQSSTQNLAFLTDTDTNRKKFLINLFSLDKYLENHEQFKRISRELNNELLQVSAKQSQVSGWIQKNENEDLTIRELEPVPKVAKEDIDKLTDLKAQLVNLTVTNKHINDNNQYINLLNELDTSILSETIEIPDCEELIEERKQILKNDTSNNSHKNIAQNEITKINKLEDKCPTCTQNIDKDFIREYIEGREEKIRIYTEENIMISNRLEIINQKMNEIIKAEKRKQEQDRVSNELQGLLGKIDKTLPTSIIDENDLRLKIKGLNDTITNVNNAIKVVTQRNLEVAAHNSKVKVIKEQLQEYKDQLSLLEAETADKEFTIDKVDIIKKAFSTNGLLNYKIEYLVKDLEHQINSYLEELSNGRFQLLFALKGEKLDIEIIDDGKHIGIEELSAGELARINTSTLLAIRKLMAAISSTKLNILFLDEIMGVLDDEGKEKLIDILNSETELNTFLVSHEFTHPLIPTINIVKENKISRIE